MVTGEEVNNATNSSEAPKLAPKLIDGQPEAWYYQYTKSGAMAEW
ncbi:hypothetical protein [Dictyobacter aurantiacus]|nr:hypothetical protein [Dictyobacter aurantiacus]